MSKPHERPDREPRDDPADGGDPPAHRIGDDVERVNPWVTGVAT